MRPVDRLGRPLRDLRLSVIDRCNLRCRYCMPRETFGADFPYLPRSEILDFEEIDAIVRALLPLGIRKIRLTGGEPLLRRDLELLVGMLSRHDVDLALTTNGTLLADKAESLARAGLDRVTVSLDALDEATFQAMSDSNISVNTVLEGISAAQEAGLGPVKVNAVVQRGVNEHAVVELARYFHGTGVSVRFIEYMDVGSCNGWSQAEVISRDEMLKLLHAEFDLEPVVAQELGEVARRWRHVDGGGEIGIISSVSEPFCGDCCRARLSADGHLYTCLFASAGHDLKEPLRAGASDSELRELVTGIWQGRSDRYSEERAEMTEDVQRIEMSYIGG
jgi:cyclic pyranopterin phosphate synthase